MTPPPQQLSLKLRPVEEHTQSTYEEQDSLYGDRSQTALPDAPDTAAEINITGSGDQFFEALDSPTTTTPTIKTPAGKKTKKATAADLKKKCPCGKSDTTSSKIICNACKQVWHQNCCNCIGLTQTAIKKLTRWECPACYVCPALGKQPATIYAEIRAMKDAVSSLTLRDNMLSSSCQREIASLKVAVSAYDGSEIMSKIDMLQQEIQDLKTAPSTNRETEFSPGVKAALDAATSVLPDSINSIQESLVQLNEQITSLQSSMKNGETASHVFTQRSSRNSSPLIQPNTSSPHATKIKTPCEAYESYKKDAISAELKKEILEFTESMNSEFTTVDKDESRQVLYFGDYSYQYTGKKHPARQLPPVLMKVLDTMDPKTGEQRTLKANSCLITRYSSGKNHIPMHRDDEIMIDPESHIMTLSLGAKRTMTFSNNDNSHTKTLELEDRSLLVTSRFAQDFWKHGILPQEEVSEERISLTFREISPHFINSTILLGDSNTAKVSFGTGSGTLGAWVPGKRVKVGHIEALPDAVDIGPYRNIVIHTGINSLNTRYQPRTDTYLIHVLETKCKEYMAVYPRSRIHISMLLPTRLRRLNRHVENFNKAILDMSYQYKNIRIIDNSIFGSCLSDEHGRWNVEEQRPLVSDSLHLGRKGIRLFAANMKNAIIGKSKSQSRSRFDSSQGRYQGAVGGFHYHGPPRPP